MDERKTEQLGIKVTKSNKDMLDVYAQRFGCKPGNLASRAAEVWIDACRSAGGYVEPEFSSTQAIYEDREKELIQMVAEELGLYKPEETKKKTG